MGSINALVSSCGTANHLPHRRGGGTCSSGNRSLFPQVPPWLEGWQQSGCCRSNFTAQICKGRGWSGSAEGRGNGARMRTWRRTRPLAAQHPLAGKRTAKTEACDRSQAEVDEHEFENNHAHLYARGGNSDLKKTNGTLQSILLPLVSYRI